MNTRNRSLLQRRNSLTTMFQAFYDGLVVLMLVYLLIWALDVSYTVPYLVMTLVLLGTMGVIYDRISIYRQECNIKKKASNLGKAWSLSFVILLAVSFLTNNAEFFSKSFGILLFISGYTLQLLGHIAFRYFQYYNRSHDSVKKTLIIGTGPLADYIYDRINSNPWMSEKVVGVITIQNESLSEDVKYIAPILGNLSSIMDLISEYNIQTIYIAIPLNSSSMIKDIYLTLLNANLNIHWAPDILAFNLINHSVKELSGIPIFTLSESPLIGTHLLIKEIEDRILATLCLVLASPIMLFTAIAIKLESPGPVFFRQTRTGWDGKEFKIWKFRSMHFHYTSDIKLIQATRNDSRVTQVGRFIRKTSIDELPQLFNVLSGSMSIVGPRPHAVQHNEEYSEKITAYLARHRIKPGITGLAQIRGLRGETREIKQMEQRVKSDLEYINNWSLWLDINIILKTFLTLLNKNAY